MGGIGRGEEVGRVVVVEIALGPSFQGRAPVPVS